MIALRLAGWVAAVAAILVAQRATAPLAAPAAALVFAAAVAGLLAPLFWPGAPDTARGTLLRIAGWPAAAAAVAVAGGFWLAPVARIDANAAALGAMLWLVLAVSLAAAALIERRLSRHSPSPLAARATAAGIVVVALAVLGALPLWLGPTADLLSQRHAWVLDAVVGASPLTHLAVAADNDLLRNDWFYQRSTLAGLPFAYPSGGALTAFYVAAGAMLAVLLMRRQQAGAPHPIDPETETFR